MCNFCLIQIWSVGLVGSPNNQNSSTLCAMIITISGTPGSGKSTVGKLLAKKFRYRYYSIGAIRRAMAKERGMTLQEFNVLGETKAFTDTEVDQWQAKLGREHDNLVVEGRTSFHFIPHAVKLFLAADLNVAAKRIFYDGAHARRFEASHHYQNPAELAHGLKHRIASDTRRYKKYYGLNIFLKRHYDFYLDTTKLTPTQTVRKIMAFLAKVKQKNKGVDAHGIKKQQSTGSKIKLRKRSGKKKR